jgi:hypothetical protein
MNARPNLFTPSVAADYEGTREAPLNFSCVVDRHNIIYGINFFGLYAHTSNTPHANPVRHSDPPAKYDWNACRTCSNVT